MKKRLLSLLLVLALCLSMLPAQLVFAEDSYDATLLLDEAQESLYSSWAEEELNIGSTYGLFPVSWNNKDLRGPIKQSQLRVLFAKVRGKLSESGCATQALNNKLTIKNTMTVEEVLNAFYGLISNYEYTNSIGLEKKYSPSAYMNEYGIFTGEEGELQLSDICTLEQACTIAVRLVTYLYDALDAGSKGFLWVAKNGGNTVYLLGSVHLANTSIYPFSNKILNAFQSSDALMVEANPLDVTATIEALGKYGVYTDGTTLKDHVSEETYQMTIQIAELLGYPEEQIALFKPWCIYIMFSGLTTSDTASEEEAAESSALGIDMKFIIDAIETNKPIFEIEGMAYQAMLLDSFSDDLEELLLVSTLMMLNSILTGTYVGEDENYLDAFLGFWKEGDAKGIYNYLNASNEIIPEDMLTMLSAEDLKELKKLNDEYQEKFFTQRDSGMAEYIDQLLKSEGSATYFVVVGSAHYISDYSVLDILEEKGYEIERIK